jgi:hypothetical protein
VRDPNADMMFYVKQMPKEEYGVGLGFSNRAKK